METNNKTWTDAKGRSARRLTMSIDDYNGWKHHVMITRAN